MNMNGQNIFKNLPVIGQLIQVFEQHSYILQNRSEFGLMFKIVIFRISFDIWIWPPMEALIIGH